MTVNVDSARGHLAGTFVNAFLNAGFGNETHGRARGRKQLDLQEQGSQYA
jgi:hypothetical protein